MNELAKKRKIVMKVTVAEENRQREIQRRLQAIRNHVIYKKTIIRNYYFLCFVLSVTQFYYYFIII